MELNPNHPVAQALHNQWHKLAALLMFKLEVDHVVISAADIAQIGSGLGIAAQEKPDGIHLTLVDMATAHAIARREGGLPS